MHDAAGVPVAGAKVVLHAATKDLAVRTGNEGAFEFKEVPAGKYAVNVQWSGGAGSVAGEVEFAAGAQMQQSLRLTASGGVLLQADSQSTGNEQLTGKQVSALPLNKRDFSQLLLQAAGTQTDTNGAANFTQQFTVNGQRGTATVFAMDGVDTTDPEMGGATFSNFNVDAIQEINSSSGVMPADIGHGAAGFTAITTKSGTNDLHGSLFEFVRNAAFDARNFFDRRSVAQPGRIPPFARNEFGVANGGPVVLPGYDGRNRTFYFAQYQGFRQVLGTTQVLPVPTADERRGLDTTAFPGDTLIVPVSPKAASVLAAYPLPNDPQGSYGARTYATSSKVRTQTDQFSVRLDHKVSDKLALFARFNLNNVDGPLTNPDQTAINPSFSIPFLDRQRNAGFSATYTPSARFTAVTTLGYIRSTPTFSAHNQTQSGVTFADGAFEPYNSPAGSIMGAFGNLFQARQDFTIVSGKHTWQTGFEARVNLDTTIFGIDPNGLYTFGGGAAYSPVSITSLSGAHNIDAGGILPDSLTGFLTATPFAYSVAAAPPMFAQGDMMGEAAVRRQAFNVYFKDTWKIAPGFSLSYGLRYEVNSRIHEGHHLTSGTFFDSDGARFLINPDPHYQMDWNGWGPRLAFDWKLNDKTIVRAGGSITTLLPNLWQQNSVTGGLPFVASLYESAAPGAPVPFSNAPAAITLPNAYTPSGQLIYATGNSMDVAPNTVMDITRFERDLAALSPDKQIRAVSTAGMDPNTRNGYVGSYTAGVERKLSDITLDAAYVAAVGVKLARMDFPNGYGGAGPSVARYTQFDASGKVSGGFGPITIIGSDSHSTYHSLQVSASKTSLRYGLGFQASYTFSKSLDDTSAVLGGFVSSSSGTVLQSSPQNPFNIGAEKAPSTFDATHSFSFNAVQDLAVGRVPLLRLLGKRFTAGWSLLGVGSLSTGSPFTVFSGIQQTAVGANGADRPDQIGTPSLSTSRTVREDYFGLGANNASLFSIPIDVAGGTGPNQGRFGTLGRNTFRGPGFHNFDMSLIKNTPIGLASNPERAVLQFRAEVFNVFNLVNFGLPNNVLLGPGFGLISRTSGSSRQIQLSLKVLF
ncbi:MAG: TonB-dependent receptor [Bryobacteraceae bacterium]|nr:TonB-dependent receptor [Bryobacteraceae bacterium]